MQEYVKGVVWPRPPTGDAASTDAAGKPVYRYVFVGMIVSDEPVDAFEGRAEVVLDGFATRVLPNLAAVPSRAARVRVGDATDVLVSMRDL